MLSGRVRAIAVAICSFVFPGLGQAILKQWVRAFLFGSLALATFAFFAPDLAITADMGVEGALAEAQRVTNELSLAGNVALTVVQFAAMLDAYLHAIQDPHRQSGEGPTCPRCGREIEPSHGFCQWCTYEFEDPTEDASSAPSQ
jgi:hypothetical protein